MEKSKISNKIFIPPGMQCSVENVQKSLSCILLRMHSYRDAGRRVGILFYRAIHPRLDVKNYCMLWERHCEGDRPKQSIENQSSGLFHSVRNDEKTEFFEVPLYIFHSKVEWISSGTGILLPSISR